MIGNAPSRGTPRRWLFLPLCVAMFPPAGCNTTSTSHKPLAAVRQMLPGQKDAELRKKVEADSFPTAEKAGIQ